MILPDNSDKKYIEIALIECFNSIGVSSVLCNEIKNMSNMAVMRRYGSLDAMSIRGCWGRRRVVPTNGDEARVEC